MSLSKQAVRTIYEAELARLSGEADPHLQAFRGTRTRVHEALQAAEPLPALDPGEDAEVHHARQKAAGKAMWLETDAAVAEAGITESGVTP